MECFVAGAEVKQSAAIQQKQPKPSGEPEYDLLRCDPRWVLAQRVASGPHFARSSLLANFLLYVVSEMLAGRGAAISEHKIGVAVFGRPPSYRTDDDNIVRNYARQLRKRLAEHFAGVGSEEPIRIDIPVGGYVPLFIKRHPELAQAGSLLPPPSHGLSDSRPGRFAWIAQNRLSILSGIALAAGLALILLSRNLLATRGVDENRALWKAIFASSSNTYIVPPDAGFNLLEDMAHRSYPLAAYIKGAFVDAPDGRVNNQTDRDIRTQQYTDFISTEIVALLARQPEYDPRRVFLRFPRDLRISDLKASNALVIGSVSSNPWAGLIDASANFHIVPSDDMESAQIVNNKPLPGEASAYVSHWNEPAHVTYALILFLPNLSGNGHVLLVEGLDVAGTQAAAELLFHPEALMPILRSSRQSDASLRPFEILLRTTSIESNSAGTQIIASRIH